MNSRVVALVLALIGLGLFVVARRRIVASGKPAPPLAFALVPIAGIIGLLPQILHLAKPIETAGSVLSIILSVAAIVLLLTHAVRNRKA